MDSARFTGFHYVDWIFDGPDILFAPRTGYRGANTYVEQKRGGEGRRNYLVRCALCAVCCVLCVVCCVLCGMLIQVFSPPSSTPLRPHCTVRTTADSQSTLHRAWRSCRGFRVRSRYVLVYGISSKTLSVYFGENLRFN